MAESVAAPVTMGSSSFDTLDLGHARVVAAGFPAHARLHAHTHDRANIAVMLHGNFTTSIGARRIACDPMTVWTEPCEERHANDAGSRGAQVVVIQPASIDGDVFGPFAAMLDVVRSVVQPEVAADARRIWRELRALDPLSPLVVESLMMAMLATSTRVFTSRHADRRPVCAMRARDLIHARFREPLRLTAIAAEVGAEAGKLARAFRTAFGMPMGSYARALRREWALDALVRTDRSVSEIALEAGYCDQSHFTRECRRAVGMGPAAFRRLRRPSDGAGGPPQ